MSFLNPVNEPVLRFKSTDAGAPQINYNVRTAGDVKAVLKACLVTGYGAVASAGWSVVNEFNHVAEFVSPSTAMSDYRLGIDDTSTSSTTWYYQYQDVRTNPSYNTPIKSFTNANKTYVDNGWQLLVTERGIMFIELIQHSAVNKLSARITYWGQIKSAISDTTGKNICFFGSGHNASIPYTFFSLPAYNHTQLESNTSAYVSTATLNALIQSDYIMGVSNIDLVSPIYLASSTRDMIIAELPPMLSKIVNQISDNYGVSESVLGGRNMLSVTAGYAATASTANSYARTFLIPTDYWEY